MGNNKLTKDLFAKPKKLEPFLSPTKGTCGIKRLDPIRDTWQTTTGCVKGHMASSNWLREVTH